MIELLVARVVTTVTFLDLAVRLADNLGLGRHRSRVLQTLATG